MALFPTNDEIIHLLIIRKNMAKRRSNKTRSKKKKRNRSYFYLRVFLYMSVFLYRVSAWICVRVMRASRKNPLLALGLCCFLFAFALIFYNASFLQNGFERPSLIQEGSSLDSRLRSLISNARN